MKLFGVRIEAKLIEEEGEEVIKKSKSLGNLQSWDTNKIFGDNGYLSDGGLLQNSRTRTRQERKRGVPWTEEEHRIFLAGLEKLGKGDWRGIARNFVTTRTPTQVASHAQKYFLRQSNPNKKKRRSSLFDVGINDNVIPTPAATSAELYSTEVDSFAAKESHQFKEDHLADGLYLISTPAISRVLDSSQIFTLINNNSTSSNFQTARPLGGSYKDETNLELAIRPDFLQLSLTKSPSGDNSNLELSIAPPELHPQHATGAISVI